MKRRIHFDRECGTLELVPDEHAVPPYLPSMMEAEYAIVEDADDLIAEVRELEEKLATARHRLRAQCDFNWWRRVWPVRLWPKENSHPMTAAVDIWPSMDLGDWPVDRYLSRHVFGNCGHHIEARFMWTVFWELGHATWEALGGNG